MQSDISHGLSKVLMLTIINSILLIVHYTSVFMDIPLHKKIAITEIYFTVISGLSGPVDYSYNVDKFHSITSLTSFRSNPRPQLSTRDYAHNTQQKPIFLKSLKHISDNRIPCVLFHSLKSIHFV